MDSIVKYHLVNIGLFYSRNYDFGLFEDDNYKIIPEINIRCNKSKENKIVITVFQI